MIKINLLGVPRARKARKQAEGRSQIILGGVVIGATLIAVGYSWYLLDQRLSNLQKQKEGMETHLAQLKAKVKEVENFEKDKAAFEEKIRVIEQLRKNQSGPVHVLDEISRSLPDRVSLTSLASQANQLDLEGRAVTNAAIVEFIANLKNSKYFTDVELIESREVKESDISAYSFRLKCRTNI